MAAGKIKVSQPEEEDELKIILKALSDVNLPKFVNDDIALFKVRSWSASRAVYRPMSGSKVVGLTYI